MVSAAKYPNGTVLAVEDSGNITHQAMVRINWSDVHVFQLDCEMHKDTIGTQHQGRIRTLADVNCLWCLTRSER